MTTPRMPIRATWVLSLLATLAISRGALAGDAALAEQLFREGRERLDAGDYAAACPKLKESYAQDSATGTLLALALCQEMSGKTASAWASFGEVAARSRREGRADREQAAREHQTALESKLSRLTIQVDPSTASVPGLVIARDGTAVGSAAWGTPSPVDPGVHFVTATAPGKEPWKGSVNVGTSADTQTVSVPALSDAPPEATPSAPATSGSVPDAGRPAASSGAPLRTLGYVAGGVGLVGIGLGSVFGLNAKALKDESNADDHCNADNECDDVGGGKRDDAKNAATLSTVAFIAGGALLATGVALFIVGGPKSEPARAALVVLPELGQSQGGLRLKGRF
jgi:hypothetical protein